MEKPHIVLHKGEWLCHQWQGHKYLWHKAHSPSLALRGFSRKYFGKRIVQV